jgi:hypothetical protein
MAGTDALPPHAVIDGLLPAERVLWMGQPRASAYLARNLWPSYVCGLALLVFAALWELDTLRNGHLALWAAVGWLFAAAGVYAVIVRPLLRLRRARHCVYAITDRRVICARRRRGTPTVETEWGWRPARVAKPGARESEGRGRAVDVVFAGAPPVLPRWGWWSLAEETGRLVCIADAPAALEALAHLRASSARRPGAWAREVATPS